MYEVFNFFVAVAAAPVFIPQKLITKKKAGFYMDVTTLNIEMTQKFLCSQQQIVVKKCIVTIEQ